MKNIKILLITLLITTCVSVIYAQDTIDGETDNRNTSLFVGDSCTAPCWFGLTPGKSSSQDLEDMILENSEYFRDLIDSDSNIYSSDGFLVDGYDRLSWNNQVLSISSVSTILLIRVDDRNINFILSPAQIELNIADVLDIYGDPDFTSLYFGQTHSLYLIYIDKSIVISLDILKDTPFETYGGAFTVVNVRYFLSEDLEEIVNMYLVGDLYPQRFRLVPLETLHCWVEEKETCISSWWDLPIEKDIDLSLWLEVTPELEVTGEPTP